MILDEYRERFIQPRHEKLFESIDYKIDFIK